MRNDFTPVNPRELLKLNRDTLRGLRAVFGFNPSMPCLILRAETPPTKAAARRAADAAGYPADDAILLIDSSRAAYRSNDYQYDAALLDPSGALDILSYREFLNQREHGARRALDNLYAKKDYDEKRKIPGTVFYIVLQHVEHRLPPVVRDLDKIEPGKRYKTTPHGHHAEFLQEYGTNRDGARLYTWRARDAARMLDKSGYNVTGPRESLKRRAALLKEARAREAYQASDTETDAASIAADVTTLRRSLGYALVNATTDQAARLVSSLFYNRTIYAYFTDAASYITRSREKRYSSREDADRDRDALRERVSKCFQIIREATEPETDAAKEAC